MVGCVAIKAADRVRKILQRYGQDWYTLPLRETRRQRWPSIVGHFVATWRVISIESARTDGSRQGAAPLHQTFWPHTVTLLSPAVKRLRVLLRKGTACLSTSNKIGHEQCQY